jgi:hypothetical protein
MDGRWKAILKIHLWDLRPPITGASRKSCLPYLYPGFAGRASGGNSDMAGGAAITTPRTSFTSDIIDPKDMSAEQAERHAKMLGKQS